MIAVLNTLSLVHSKKNTNQSPMALCNWGVTELCQLSIYKNGFWPLIPSLSRIS